MNDILITIMLFCATLVTVFSSVAVTMFMFLLTRELIKDHLYE